MSNSVPTYDPNERVSLGPLGADRGRPVVRTNEAANFLLTKIEDEQEIEIGCLTDNLAQRYDLTPDQASHDVTQFLINALTHGIVTYLSPRRTGNRIRVLFIDTPTRFKAWLLGNRHEDPLPRRRHMEPTVFRIVSLMAVTSLPRILLTSSILALLGGWFLFQGSFLQSTRSVMLTLTLALCVSLSALLAHLLHEIAHVVAARRVKVTSRTLYYERGAVGITRDSADPQRNLHITIVGPLLGIVSATLSGAVVALVFDALSFFALARIEYLFLVIFALLPGMAQLSTLFPGTADGNSLINDSLRWMGMDT